MKLSWHTKTFAQLNTQTLFDCLELRQRVFVVEQECAYPDIDAKDLEAWHLIGKVSAQDASSAFPEGSIVAYARLLKAGVSYAEASIGRVVVTPDILGKALGRSLMLQALKEMQRLFPKQNIKIGAQFRLKDFYLSLGFSQVSEIYLEDNIPHIDMLKTIAD